MKKNLFITCSLSLCMAFGLTGCFKPSKQSVQESSYYIKLKNKNELLNKQLKNEKKRTKSLEKKIKDIHTTSGDQKLASYKKRIKDANIIKVDFASVQVKGQSFAVINAPVCQYAKKIVTGCYRMIGINPTDLDKNEKQYSYALIDEDNTTFEFKVYGNGYIVFDDIPANVYAYNDASLIGEALVDSPNQKKYNSFLDRMGDAQIIVSDTKMLSKETAIKVAKLLTKLPENGIEKGKMSTTSDQWVQWRFYTSGVVTKLIYNKNNNVICIENSKGKQAFYQSNQKTVQRLITLLK